MDNSFIQAERERRLQMWEEIQLITRERFLKSEDVKRIGCYNPGRGVWRDAKKTTGHLTDSGNGVCIGVLSVGRYDDKIDGESGSYDYPYTKLKGYDDGDIDSLRSALVLDLPVFLIQNLNAAGEVVTKKGAPFRRVDLIRFLDDCPVGRFLVFTSSKEGRSDYVLPKDVTPSCFQKRELKKTTSISKKRSRSAFKAKLINSHGKCECSLCDAPKEVIEAAHIIPVADNGSDWFGNGILLCRNHHALFDKHKWTIDPTSLGIIPKSDFDLRSLQVIRSNIRHLKHSPGKEALDWRWNQFNKE
tara:strand:- start:53 stop:958 length:906 start_codon:yes stop_codon:yes gene_type:complete